MPWRGNPFNDPKKYFRKLSTQHNLSLEFDPQAKRSGHYCSKAVILDLLRWRTIFCGKEVSVTSQGSCINDVKQHFLTPTRPVMLSSTKTFVLFSKNPWSSPSTVTSFMDDPLMCVLYKLGHYSNTNNKSLKIFDIRPRIRIRMPSNIIWIFEFEIRIRIYIFMKYSKLFEIQKSCFFAKINDAKHIPICSNYKFVFNSFKSLASDDFSLFKKKGFGVFKLLK